jgi:hypothetical protein
MRCFGTTHSLGSFSNVSDICIGHVEEEEQESLAKSLIEKLGLYEEFPTIHGSEGDGKGDVESE